MRSQGLPCGLLKLTSAYLIFGAVRTGEIPDGPCEGIGSKYFSTKKFVRGYRPLEGQLISPRPPLISGAAGRRPAAMRPAPQAGMGRSHITQLCLDTDTPPNNPT